MAMPSELIRIRRETNRLVQTYVADFVGKPRATRDGSALRTITQQAEALVARLEELAGQPAPPEVEQLLKLARRNLALYRGELGIVEEALRLGADYDAFARLASHANALLANYDRHFGGNPRLVRDPVFLDDLIDALARIEKAMRPLAVRTASFAHDVETLTRAIAGLQSESSAIVRAQQAGSPTERYGLLSNLQNEQVSCFVKYVSSRPRALARPALLKRVIRSGERIVKMMQDLKGEGLENSLNESNIGVAERNIQAWKKELSEVETARAGIWPATLVKAMGDAARAHYKTYELDFKGRSVFLVNIALLDKLCDELHDVVWQLDEVRPELRDETHREAFDTTLIWLLKLEEAHATVLRERAAAAR